MTDSVVLKLDSCSLLYNHQNSEHLMESLKRRKLFRVIFGTDVWGRSWCGQNSEREGAAQRVFCSFYTQQEEALCLEWTVGWMREEQGDVQGYIPSTHTRHFSLLQLSDWIQVSTKTISLQCQFVWAKVYLMWTHYWKDTGRICSEILNAALLQDRNCHLIVPAVWFGVEEWCQ